MSVISSASCVALDSRCTMAPSGINIVEIFRCLVSCLRHSYESLRLIISSLSQLRLWWPSAVLFPPSRDTAIMTTDQSIWQTRLTTIAGKVLDFAWICIIYFLSELIVWGLSQAFAPADLEFFSSICGMVLIFALMTSLGTWSATVNEKYLNHVKRKVTRI